MKDDINILHVDDETHLLDQAKLFLKREGNLNVITASSAEEGLELLDKEDFDVIVSDYQMPEIDGLDFLEEIRNKREMDIPFIMFTGKGREEVAMKALNLGADRYLQKGGDPKSQYEVLAQAIQQEERHYRTRGALKLSEERYESIIQDVMDHSDVAMFILDSDFEVVWINQATEDYFGIEKEQVIGKDKEELIRDKIKYIFEKPDHFEEKVISTYKDNTYIENFECHVLQDEEKGLEERWLKHWSKPIETGLYEGGRMEHYTDITAQKESEREKEKHLQKADERVKELSCLYSLERVIQEKDRIEDVLRQAVKLIPPSWQYPDVTEARITYRDRVLETDDFEETEWMLKSEIKVNGKEVGDVEVGYLEKRPEEYEGPFLKEEVDLINSITDHIGLFIERKRAEEELQSERNFLKQIAETSPVCITKVDKDGDILWANDRAEEVLGLSKSEIEDRTYDDPKWKITDFEGEEYPVEELPFELVKEKEEAVYDVRHAIEWPDGERKLLSVNAAPLYDEENKFDGVVSTIDDVTEKKEKEKELEETKDRLYEIIDEVSVPSFVIDENHKVTHWNKACEELTGLSKDEMIGRDEPWKAFYEEERPVLADMVVEDASFEEIERHYGEKVEESSLIEGAYEGEDRFVMKGEEVWIFFTSSPIEDSEGNRVGAIETLQDITERKKKEEELRESEERYRRLFETAYDGMLIIDAKSGKIKDANPHLQNIIGYSKEELVGKELWEIGTFKDIAENKKRFQELVEEGLIRYEDLPLNMKDGEEVPVEFLSNTYDVGGEKVVQCNIREVGERKKAEERREFLHSILRHDVRNKIQVAKGYIQMMKEENEDYLDDTLKSIQSAEEIIEKVRILQKVETGEEVEEFELDNLIEDVISEYEEQAREKGIALEVHDLSYKVKGGPLLNTLFGNLIENSIQHGGCEKIMITGEVEGEECIVTVEDDGKGLSDDVKEKIFERGYKKGENAGSGLGMYLVKEIVEGYDGSIEVKDSELGGAKFKVYLEKV